MSMFDTPSVDNASGVEATAGASRGFAQSVSDAYNAGYKAMSVLGVRQELDRVQREQDTQIQKVTGKWPEPVLVDGSDQADLARFFEEGGTPDIADAIAKHDKMLSDLSSKHPELKLKTSSELWGQVKDEAQKAEQIAASPGSTIGGFIGDTAAAFDPRVNLPNTLSLGVAPFGKTVALRVASAAGLGGVTQALSEVTGVNENRRLLGLETGFGDSATRVLTTAVGGAAIQGLGEAAVAGVKKLAGRRPAPAAQIPPAAAAAPAAPQPGAGATSSLLERPGLFRDFQDFEAAVRQDVPGTLATAAERAAARGPYGKSRLAIARHETDMATIEAQMQQLNRGENLKLSTKLHEPPAPLEREVPHWMRPAEERVPQIARQIDPELYAQVDKLEALITAERNKMVGARTKRDALPVEELDAALKKADDLEGQIATMRSQLVDADRRKVKKLEGKIAALEQEQRQVIEGISPEAEAAGGFDTEIGAASNRLAALEQELRALAPLRKRAENVAIDQYLNDEVPLRGIFTDYAADVRSELRIADTSQRPLIQSRRPSEKLTADEGGNDVTPGTPNRPGTTSGPDPEAAPGDGVDSLLKDLSHENTAQSSDVLALFEAVEAVRGGHQGEIVMGGRRYNLDDEIPVAPLRDADGNINGLRMQSIRSILKEVGDDADMLASMRSCSI